MCPLGFNPDGSGFLVQRRNDAWTVRECDKAVVQPDEPPLVQFGASPEDEGVLAAIQWQREWQGGADSVWTTIEEAEARALEIEKHGIETPALTKVRPKKPKGG